MRVNGAWLPCEDEIVRPVVPGMVRLADGNWLEVPFLLDGGADRTVFSARFFHGLQHLKTDGDDVLTLSGVGGAASSITVKTAIAFLREDGRTVTVRGPFGVFVEIESADLSVLGRDVTNNFSVIYDYPDQTVTLLAAPHSYIINE